MNESERRTDGTGQKITKRKVAIAGLVAIALLAILVAVSVLTSGGTVQNSTPDTSAPAATSAQEPAEEQQEACEHDWTVTYKTVHHDAVTHTETIEPDYANETTYHTVCNECGQVIDGIADQHIKETGHSGYSTNVPITNEVLVSEGYTQEVVDTPAYDETVADELVCTLCGETRPVTSADGE